MKAIELTLVATLALCGYLLFQLGKSQVPVRLYVTVTGDIINTNSTVAALYIETGTPKP